MRWFIDGEVARRVARKDWNCSGNGAARQSAARQYAENCSVVIRKGEEYAEDMREARPFAAGSRHCMACSKRWVL